MKRTRIWMLLASWALAAAGGCGKASSEARLGGETDWLQRCSTSGSSTAGSDPYECGPNLECVCGLCTRACSSDSACASLSTEGRCSESATTQFASACELDAPEQICVRAPSEGGPPAPRLGRRFDVAGQCYGALALAGYSAAGAAQACLYPNAVGVRQGDCWQFPDGCLPDGFFDANENPLLDPVPCPYPEVLCPEELSCSAERVPTGAGCVSCEDARRKLTFSMIELVVRAELDQCTYDSDCVAEGWENGCDGQCPVAVGRDFSDTFRSALPSLTRHYCSDPPKWRTTCGQRVGDCVVAPLCRQGRCVISALPCGERELADCESDGDCALVRANPFNATTQCFASTTSAVACADPDFTCPPVTRPALDTDGNCFLFGDCLPAGFDPAPTEHPCSASSAAMCAP